MLVCSLTNDGTAGLNNVTVFVPGKGRADVRNVSAPITAFANPLIVSSVVPDQISTLGGGNMTLTGTAPELVGTQAARLK